MNDLASKFIKKLHQHLGSLATIVDLEICILTLIKSKPGVEPGPPAWYSDATDFPTSSLCNLFKFISFYFNTTVILTSMVVTTILRRKYLLFSTIDFNYGSL